MTCRLCHKDIPNGADVHYDCLMKANVESMNRYSMMPFQWGVNLVKFMRTYEFDEPEGVIWFDSYTYEFSLGGPSFVNTFASEYGYNSKGGDIVGCDRCYKDEWGQGPYETSDGYICESCYQDDVSKAEYIGEGDR